jgi:hypothetical protein
MRNVGAFVLLVTALAMPARAADTGNDYYMSTGNDYMHKCGTISAYDASFAVMARLRLRRADNSQLKLCIPGGVSENQLREVTLNFMHRHPERLHNAVELLMADAFTDAWPCK